MQKLHKYQRNYCPIVSVMILLGFVCASFSILGLAIFSVLSISSLLPDSAYADTNTSTTPAASASVSPTTSTINVNLSDGITIRVLDSTATSDLEDLVYDFTPTDNGVSSTKNAIVEVGTSNETGYTLYMQSDWEDHEGNKTTSLIHTTNTIEDSIPTRLPSAISSGGALADVLPSDYPFWYYYNTKDEEDKVIPAHGNPDTLAEAKEAVEADRTTVPVTVGVDTSIVSGTYRNKLVFTAVGNQLPVDYTLHFNANTTDMVAGTPEDLESTVVASSKTFTIPSGTAKATGSGSTTYNTLSRNEKVFLGWSEDMNATVPEYKAGDEITLIADNQSLSENQSSEKTLHAVWHDDFWGITNMQDMRPEVCDSVYTPSNATGSAVTLVSDRASYASVTADGTANVAQRTLYDTRTPGTGYTIRKLADGNCWMTSDLALPLAAGTTVTASKNDGSTFDFTPTSCSANGACAMNSNTRSYSDRWYYSWYAATAGMGTSSSFDVDIDGSVCPARWRLPPNYVTPSSSATKKSYGALLAAYGMPSKNTTTSYASTLDGVPFNFTRLGQFLSGARRYTNWAFYNSSTSQLSSNANNTGQRLAFAYGATVMGNSANAQEKTMVSVGAGKSQAYTIRCVAL